MDKTRREFLLKKYLLKLNNFKKLAEHIEHVISDSIIV